MERVLFLLFLRPKRIIKQHFDDKVGWKVQMNDRLILLPHNNTSVRSHYRSLTKKPNEGVKLRRKQ